MKKTKLTYKFHNPNSNDKTEKILLKIFVEANSEKVELAINSGEKAINGTYLKASGE